jgi:hypothetical protein
MKNLILFCFLTYPFLVFSQSRSSIDYVISPDFTYRIQQYEGTDFVKTVKELNDKNDLAKIGGHFGIGYNQKLTSKLWLKLGFQISNMGYRRAKQIAMWGNNNNNGVFDTTATLSNSIESSYNFNLIHLPIVLRYQFSERKFSPYFEIGVVPSYLIEGYLNFVNNGQSVKSDLPINGNFAALLHWGFGANYQLNEKWQLYFQPTIRYQLTTHSAPIKEHLYTIGIELGARMSL